MIRHFFLLAVAAAIVANPSESSAQGLPTKLSDAEFWKMVSDYSEPTGTFPSENFASNENSFQWVIPTLLRRTQPASAYIGVGPEQNFTYIAAMQPKIAFIVDIRRQAMLQHLVYKALFEMSEDRAEFLSLMFSRRRPAGLGPNTTPQALFASFDTVSSDSVRYHESLVKIKDRLVKLHGFGLTEEDLLTLDHLWEVIYLAGPQLSYGSASLARTNPTLNGAPLPQFTISLPPQGSFSSAPGLLGAVDTVVTIKASAIPGQMDTVRVERSTRAGMVCSRILGSLSNIQMTCVSTSSANGSIRYNISGGIITTTSGGVSTLPMYPGAVNLTSLMAQVDSTGTQRSFLATESNYRAVRDMEMRNMIVPVVGDFAGPKALRAVGQYLKDHGAVVSAYYTSNVEQYLFQHNAWPQFYANVSALPTDSTSTFIRSGVALNGGGPGSTSVSTLGSVKDLLAAVFSGAISVYRDLSNFAFR